MILLLSVLMLSCGRGDSQGEKILSRGLRFCESTYPYKDGILIANFGSKELNPLNSEGMGYIMYYKEGEIMPFIPADGNLNAPKGMYERNGRLFICDVNKIVVYNLDSLQREPQTIRFPEGELFVNDLAAAGNTLYASVTNTGQIFSMDISDLDTLEHVRPALWCSVPGANGITIDGNAMYVASYPPDGVTTAANVVYKIADIAHPVPEQFMGETGQYDGIALSPDGRTLYVSNWSPAGVSAVNMSDLKISTLKLGREVTGPADFTLRGDSLYIPDLPNSCVIIKAIQ